MLREQWSGSAVTALDVASVIFGRWRGGCEEVKELTRDFRAKYDKNTDGGAA
jgi:hypothetical protein